MQTVKIKTLAGDVFDLPQDFVIEGEKNNPLFSDKGSQTVSVSFPATAHNRRLLGHAARLDRARKPEQALRVLIESGPSQQAGILAVNTASPSLIQAGIGFDEAELYSHAAETQLKDIPDLPQLTLAGSTREERVDSMLAHLEAVMKEEVDADCFLFPVELKYDVVEPENDKKESAKIYRIILNEVDTSIPVDGNNNPVLPFGAVAPLAAKKHRRIDCYIDSEVVYIDAMKGYGVSPFLKVYRLLELIFENFFQVHILENPFREHRQLKKLAVLNNTMDAILTGTLHYRDLMPDITVSDFLEALFNKFGMLYFFDSNKKTVRLKFIRDILNDPPTRSLDLFKTEEPQISHETQKQLKLTVSRELVTTWGTAQTLYPTFEEFLDAYRHEFTDLFEDESNPQTAQVFAPELQNYIIREAIDTEDRQVLRSSDFFDWDRKTPGLEYREIRMSDLCLPMDWVGGMLWMLFYGVGRKHRYSNIVADGETAGDEENPATLAFVFGWGLTDYTDRNRYNWFYASQMNRSSRGHFIVDSGGQRYDLSLTVNREDGLYNRFWKEYDAFLRHSGQPVRCTLKLTGHEIFTLDLSKKFLLNGQPFLIEKLSFKLNEPKGLHTCDLRTLRLCDPCDLPAEQNIPQYVNQKYFWAPTIVKTPSLPYNFYETADELGNGFVTVDGINYSTKMLFVMPPTEEQYQNQELIVLTYQSVAHADGHPDVPLTTTVTYTPTPIIY